MRVFVAIAVLMTALVAPLCATVVIPVDLAELSREARFIARGRVVEVTGQWTDDRRTIETIVSLEPEEYLKGDLGHLLRFRVAGGTLGRFRNVVVGAPQFEIGQHVIVFVTSTGPSIPHLVGFHQGVYRVSPAASGEMQVTPAAALPASGRMVRGAAARLPAPLAAFERQVRELAGGAR